MEHQTMCAQFLQLLALCPSSRVPWSLFDGGAAGEGSIMCRGSRVELHGFVKATSNNGRRGRVMDLHQDGTVSVVFGCDDNCLSSVKRGGEVKRFKESNVRLIGPKGEHEDLLRMQSATSAQEASAEAPASASIVSDMDPALHDPRELKKLAALMKAVMPSIVHVDEVRRTFGMHAIVAEHILQWQGCPTDKMRALLHCRCGRYMDDECVDPKLNAVVREVTCVSAALAVTCRRFGGLEGEGWGSGMLLRIFEIARDNVWGLTSRVTKRCLTMAHALLAADLCHQHALGKLNSDSITLAVDELAEVPAVREVLDTCAGPFSLLRCLRAHLAPDCNKLANADKNRLKCMSWRYRTLRGCAETDETLLQQISDAVRSEADPAALWELRVVQLKALSAAASRLMYRGQIEKSAHMLEQALEMNIELLGVDHPHTMFLKVQLFGLKKQLGQISAGVQLEMFVKSGMQLGDATQKSVSCAQEKAAGGN